ncbi:MULTISPECIES: hypothetical protein [Bacillaceae]|uniref:ABC transporter ATPase n=1 Tax=Evansella alkalicola TaxID=745819 RepID=A0ABS6JZ28_9BACI|nr:MULTISPECIES: hypothetical protein [Bacillaceae]MBU9723487.1 hypothetical protein [Bacillus alkalicola]
MLGKFTENDFLVLRGPLESGRQSPKSLGSIFIICIFCQAVLLLIIFHFSEYSNFPMKDIVNQIHLFISIILGIISLLYAVPFIYKKSQKIQYLISILVSQNLFGVSLLWGALLLLGEDNTIISTKSTTLLSITYLILTIGLLIFIVTCVRFYNLIKKGHYQKGSKTESVRSKFESKTYMLPVIIGTVGIVCFMQCLSRNFEIGFMDLFYVVAPIIFFYVMLFVLPEQLVILYCKYRFDSFNFDPNGRHLYPPRNEKIHDLDNKG